MDVVPYLAAVSALAALALAFYYFKVVEKASPGNERMVFLMTEIQKGAKAFLKKEYQWVSVFVVARQAERVLADVRATGLAAVVFSEPCTHRTVQVKGENAVAGPLEEGDWPVIGAYPDLAVAELAPLGYPEGWIRKVFECTPAQMVAVRFAPGSAFAQTPGPNAGRRLAA